MKHQWNSQSKTQWYQNFINESQCTNNTKFANV